MDVAPINIRRIEPGWVSWQAALADGYPIVFGVALFDDFAECAKKSRFGVVPMPEPDSAADTVKGSHTFVAVGYSGEADLS